jgi:hypothetical protein
MFFDVLNGLPMVVDAGLGALGISLYLKLRDTFDAFKVTQNLIGEKLSSLDSRVSTLERRNPPAAH